MSTFGTTARASASSSFATSAHTLGEAQDAPVTITHFTDPMMGLS